MILPPFTIFVDEAGSSNFETEPTTPAPYVVCAVCVATSDVDFSFHALQQDPTAARNVVLIKSSHHGSHAT